jgi:hypothetical protein
VQMFCLFALPQRFDANAMHRLLFRFWLNTVLAVVQDAILEIRRPIQKQERPCSTHRPSRG